MLLVKRLSILMSLIILCSGITLDNGFNTAKIHLLVISCSEDEAVAPTIRINRWPTSAVAFPKEIRVVAQADAAHAGVYFADVGVDIGNYLVNAQSPKCKSETLSVPVFPPYERHIMILTSTKCCSLPTLLGSSVAVNAPLEVMVDLVGPARGRLGWNSGTIDNGIRYFPNLSPGLYTLQVRLAGVLACREFVIPSTVTAYQRLFTLTLDELVPLFRSAANENAKSCS
jgi:hypothetical protein